MKISYAAHDQYHGHLEFFLGGALPEVRDAHVGIIYRPITCLLELPGQVGVLEIHEESRIKPADLPEGLHAAEHERPRHEGNIVDVVVPDILHHIAVQPSSRV